MHALGRPSINIGRQRQEQLEQAIAMWTPGSSSPDRDHVQHLQEQLAYKDVQLEHARSQRDIHFVQKEEFLTHIRLLSSEAKEWKPRIVNEAQQVFVRESAEAARRTTEIQETMFKQHRAHWKEAEVQIRACKSPTALKLSN